MRPVGSRLPKHASLACKPKDVDACLVELGFAEPPWDRLYFGLRDLSQSPRERPPAAIKIAEASRTYGIESEGTGYAKRVRRDLHIQVVPRSHVRPIREELRREGLALLIRWIDRQRMVPETQAWCENVRLFLDYDVEEGKLRPREVITPVIR